MRWGIPERWPIPTSPSHRSATGPSLSPLKGGEGKSSGAARQPAAGRRYRARSRPGLSGPVCHLADGQGRGRRHQDRAAAGRAAAPARAAGQEHDLSDRHAQRQQAGDHPQFEGRARPRPPLPDGREGRRAARKLRARRHGPARGRLECAARDQPAPRLCLGLGVWAVRPRPRQSGDGPDDPGGLRPYQHDRVSRRAAGQGRTRGRRFPFRHPPLCRDGDRPLRARAHRPRAPRRGRDGRGCLRHPHLAAAGLFRDRQGAAAHRQFEPRPLAARRLSDDGRLRRAQRRRRGPLATIS